MSSCSSGPTLCASSLQLQLSPPFVCCVVVAVVVAADVVQPDAIDVRAIDELRIEHESSSTRQAVLGVVRQTATEGLLRFELYNRQCGQTRENTQTLTQI